MDKYELIRQLFEASMVNPIIHTVLSHYGHKYGYSPDKPMEAILDEHYDEIIHAVILNLLKSNTQLQESLKEHLMTHTKPVILN